MASTPSYCGAKCRLVASKTSWSGSRGGMYCSEADMGEQQP